MNLKQEFLNITGTLYRVALQILQNQQDAEDAVSDFYIKVMEKRDQFSRYDSLKAALIRSMKNHCLNLIKSRKRFHSVEEISIELPSLTNDCSGSEERLLLVQKIIDELSVKQKIIIELRMVECLPMKQIADIMEEKVNTVEKIISRVRKKIRIEYENRKSK